MGEPTVYRLLKKEGLVKPPGMKLLAGKEYQRKTSGPNQMWAIDASYFRVRGAGLLLHHPQTNGKLERYHQSIKYEVDQVPYEVPSELEVAIAGFVDYYNNRRYHKALDNVTLDDVLHGRREVKAQTLASRKRYNHLLRGSYNTAISP